MTTKAEVANELRKHCANATLIDTSTHDGYQAKLEAPEGHHWEGKGHCKHVPFWFKGGSKGEYWNEVIGEVRSLPKAVKCLDEACEGIEEFGECEYWS